MSKARHKKEKKMAKGGKAEHFITGEGSPEAHEAEKKEDGFKRGGKKKHGGKMEHEKSHHRTDKKKRGGKMAAGGSPMSAANKITDYAGGDRGYQSSKPGMDPEKD